MNTPLDDSLAARRDKWAAEAQAAWQENAELRASLTEILGTQTDLQYHDGTLPGHACATCNAVTKARALLARIK